MSTENRDPKPTRETPIADVLDAAEAVIRDGEVDFDEVVTPEKAREAQLELVAHIRDQLSSVLEDEERRSEGAQADDVRELVDGPEAPTAFGGSLLDGLTVDAVEAEVMRSRLTWPRAHATRKTLLVSLTRKHAELLRMSAVDPVTSTEPIIEALAIEVAALALRIVEEGRR